jgi:hypothetical protein
MPVKTPAQPQVAKADLQFMIDQLRKDKMIFSLESIKVSVVMMLSAVFLPELVYRVMYMRPDIQIDPEMLSWIPVITYAIALLYFLFSASGNIARWSKIRQLEQSLAQAKK